MLIGVVPMAGYAERWNPYPNPKELVPFGSDELGKPRVIADHLIDSMIMADVDQLLVLIRPEKAYATMNYFGHQLNNGAPISYFAAPGPTLLANLQACGRLLQGHTVLFGMPDTLFQPKMAFCSCIEQLYHPSHPELVLGCFPHTDPEELDVISHNDSVLSAVFPKPRATNIPETDVWGLATWGPSFTMRLLSWQPQNGPTPGYVFQASAAAGLARCCVFTEGRYEDIGNYHLYVNALLNMEIGK